MIMVLHLKNRLNILSQGSLFIDPGEERACSNKIRNFRVSLLSASAPPRTHIWRRATTLRYDDFLKHLAYLAQKNLIEEESRESHITKKGRDIYEKLCNVLTTIHDAQNLSNKTLILRNSKWI